ncbi:hypothetical protein [Streptomyces sp. WAC 06738]|uniref:hypothetical protein n=1 Tax=Streptomyces sp. WAC 06738 TaxID=2203210 RepID=UPI000F793B6F|nr:hypothetical protein [Streptomyces sp. WAC 06738]
MLEAVEMRPWRPDSGRPPRVRVYPARHPPRLLVRTEGDWRTATVMARHDWPDGKIGLQVTIRLPAPDLDGMLQTFCRTYRWDRRTMRLIPSEDGSESTDTSGEVPNTG